MKFIRWEELTSMKANLIAKFPSKTARTAAIQRPFKFMALPKELRDMVYDTIAEDDRRPITIQLPFSTYQRPCIDVSIDTGLQPNYCRTSQTFRKEYIEAMNRRKPAGKVTMSIDMGCASRPSRLGLEYCDPGLLSTIGRLEITRDCFMFCAGPGNADGCVEMSCTCGRYLRWELDWFADTIAAMPRSSSPGFRCSVALTVRGSSHTERSLPVATDFWSAAHDLTQLEAVDEVTVYGTNQWRICEDTPGEIVAARQNSTSPKLCAQWTRRRGWSPRRKLVRGLDGFRCLLFVAALLSVICIFILDEHSIL